MVTGHLPGGSILFSVCPLKAFFPVTYQLDLFESQMAVKSPGFLTRVVACLKNGGVVPYHLPLVIVYRYAPL